MFKGCIKGLVVCNCLWGIMSGYVEGMKEALYDAISVQSTLDVNENLQKDKVRTVLSKLSNVVTVFYEEATDDEIEGLACPLSFVFDKHWEDIKSACIQDSELSSYFQNIVRIIPRIFNSCGFKEKENFDAHSILEESGKDTIEKIRERLNSIALSI